MHNGKAQLMGPRLPTARRRVRTWRGRTQWANRARDQMFRKTMRSFGGKFTRKVSVGDDPDEALVTKKPRQEASHGASPEFEHAAWKSGTRRRKHTPAKEQEKPREGSHRGWRNV